MRLTFKVTTPWFRSALMQLESIASNKITSVRFWHVLAEKENYSAELWREVDGMLDQERFKHLTRVKVACVRRGGDQYERVEEFNSSQLFPILLPKVAKRNLLSWT